MDWSELDLVTGLPIDDEGTKDYHQFLSADQNHLYFNVFYAPLKNLETVQYYKESKLSLDEYINKMCSKTPSTLENFRKIEQLQSKFIKLIRPHGARGFQKGEIAKTIQFVLSFNDNYQKTDFGIKPILGLINERFTCQQAENDVYTDKPNYILSQLLHFYIANYVITDRDWEQKLSYNKILSDIGGDICKEVAKMAFAENLDLICRIDPTKDLLLSQFDENNQFDMNKSVIDRTRRYRSITKQNSRGTKNDVIIDNAVVPITASRKWVDYWNIRAVAQELIMDSSEPMPDGISTAFANYNRHIINGQRLGFLCH